MLLNNNKKLLVIFALTLLQYTQARSVTITQIGNVTIEITQNKFLCDQIECPENTDFCYVTETNENSSSILNHNDICFTKNYTILNEKVWSTSTNPDSKIDVHIIAYADGTILSFDSQINEGNNTFSNIEGKKLKELEHKLGEVEEKIKEKVESMQKELGKDMETLHDKLKKMEENIGEKIQSEMHKMEEGLEHMFG